MIQMVDVNVLIHAVNEDFEDNESYRVWLQDWMDDSSPFGMSELVLSAFIRLTTNPKVLATPMEPQQALEYVEQIADQPHCRLIFPGRQNWEIFTTLCRETQARINTVPDAYFAALAIEHDCEWLTADTGFKKYPGLRWRHPLEN